MSSSSYYSSQVLNLASARVLVIDDDISNYDILQALLKRAGIGNVLYAQTIETACDIISQTPPEIILLDIMMPDISGFDFCQMLKRDPASAKIPVIFISALRGADIRARAFELGGVDYLQKPYDSHEIIARIRTHLHNGLLMKSLEKQADTMRQELELGARMQQSLLPSTEQQAQISTAHQCRIASVFVPSSALAGDFWQLLPVDDNHFAIAVCDFSGHGVASALETARFHSLLYELKPLWGNPRELMLTLNQRMYQMLPPETFATFKYALINSQDRTARVLGAGAPSFMHLQRHNGAQLHHHPSLPLGTTLDWPTDTPTTELHLAADDALVFYSDALTELPLKDSRVAPLSATNLHNLATSSGDAENLCQALLAQYNSADPAARNDDLTLVSCVF